MMIDIFLEKKRTGLDAKVISIVNKISNTLPHVHGLTYSSTIYVYVNRNSIKF